MSRPFSITARAAPSLDSCYHYEALDDRLDYGSVVIARFLSKSKDDKEDNYTPDHDPASQFESQLMYRSGAPNDGGQLSDFGNVLIFWWKPGVGCEFRDRKT